MMHWLDRLLTAFMSLLAYLLLVLGWSEPPIGTWISARTAALLILAGAPLIAAMTLAPGADRRALVLTRVLAAALIVTGLIDWAGSPVHALTPLGLSGLGFALWAGRGVRRRQGAPDGD